MPVTMRGIVREVPVAVNLAEIFKQQTDEIVGVGALRVPRELEPLPGADVGEKFAPQLFHFVAEALDFGSTLFRWARGGPILPRRARAR